MSDYDSSNPVRSEADGTDERVQVKIVDKSLPDSQQATVDTDSNVKVGVYGDDPAASDVALRLSQLGAPNPDGDYDATNNTKPASSGLIAHDRGGTIDETSLNKRVTAVAGADNTIPLDVAIRDESGAAFSNSNPMPVAISESEGDEVEDYQTSSAVAKDASVTHDYTVTTAKTFIGKGLWVAGSGKMKVEYQKEDGVAAGTYTTVYVGFNSTANPNIEIPLRSIHKQIADANVRVQITNLDNQAQDLYSTLQGIEI